MAGSLYRQQQKESFATRVESVHQDGVRLLHVTQIWPTQVVFRPSVLLDGLLWEFPARIDLLSQARSIVLYITPGQRCGNLGSVPLEGSVPKCKSLHWW